MWKGLPSSRQSVGELARFETTSVRSISKSTFKKYRMLLQCWKLLFSNTMFPGTSRSCSTSSFSSLICSIFLRIVNCGSIDSKFLCGLRNTRRERGKAFMECLVQDCRIGLLMFESNSSFIPNNSFTTHKNRKFWLHMKSLIQIF